MRIGDAGFYARLTELLQSRDPIAIPDLIDPSKIGITIAIPADLLLARARRASIDAGDVKRIQVPNPAAGADWTFTVPDNRIYRLRAVYWLFTTGAAVANRRVRLAIDDGSNNLFALPASFAQGASEAWDYSVALAAPVLTGASGTGDLASSRSLPDIILLAGYRLRVATANIQAADQFANISLQVEDYSA